MGEHELTPMLSKYLDRHLVFPLLEFLQEKGIYEEHDLMQGKLALLTDTNMVDFAMDIHKELNNTEEVPAAMKEHRVEVIGRLRQLQADVDPIIKCLEDQNVTRNFRKDKSFNIQFLQEDHDIGPANIEALYQYSKFQFDCGNYSLASELLQSYRGLCTSGERNLAALWGMLASDILMHKFEGAKDGIMKLKEAIDNQTFAAPLMQLQQRTWLLHWSLFVFWNHEAGRQDLVDLFLSPPYLSAIQINGQHLLRYVAAAVIVNKTKDGVAKDGSRASVSKQEKQEKDLIKTIQHEAYEYSDPITQFVECLFVHYDFDGAQEKLAECEAVIDNDFFLTACREEFVENARLHMFETYCRIHQCIDFKMLAGKLGKDEEAGEKWITNLILKASLNAKIDNQAGTVVMGTQSLSIHEELTKKAKALSVLTFRLANTVVGSGRA